MKHKRFYTLDAMRGVAALAVVGFHIGGVAGSGFFPRVHGFGDRASWRALIPVGILGSILVVLSPVGFNGLYDAAMIFLAMPLLLWAGAANHLPGRMQKIGGVLGDISYPLYAIHYPLLQAFNNIAVRRLHMPAATVMIFVAGMVWLSWYLAHRFDAPVRRWLSGRARLRPAAMPVGS